MRFFVIATVAILTTGVTTYGNFTQTFAGTSGNLAASAKFDLTGTSLKVTLTNTSTHDVLIPSDVLTAVFFDTTAALTPVSALIASGSTWYFDTVAPTPGTTGGNVGGEWEYKSPLSGAPGAAQYGISSSGLGGVIGSIANFGGVNLQGPAAPDGLQYGITSAGDNPATGNAAVTGGNALIKNAVVFTLTSNLSTFSINNVSFQYGTALTEANIPAVPAPGAALLVAIGMGTLGWVKRWSQS